MSMTDTLTVAAFERGQLKDGDITKDFMGRVFPSLPNLQDIIAPQVANETISAEAMDILQQHRLQRFGDQPNIFTTETDRLRHVLTQLDRNLPGYTRPQLLRSEEHTSELQSLTNLVCRLLLEKKKKQKKQKTNKKKKKKHHSIRTKTAE